MFLKAKTHYWHKCGENGPLGEAFLQGSVAMYVHVQCAYPIGPSNSTVWDFSSGIIQISAQAWMLISIANTSRKWEPTKCPSVGVNETLHGSSIQRSIM